MGTEAAVRECLTDAGVANYVLFVEGKPVGVTEAKREEEGHRLTAHEAQSEGYASAKLKYLNNEKLPFVYESSGKATRFTDFRDPKPRSRPLFSFHRQKTFREMLKRSKSLRCSLLDLPALPVERLRDCQITAITSIYRLLKYTHAKRILFLVDTKNLGEQAEQEFMAYQPNDDNRKFTELYGVHRLKSSSIPSDSQVYISTIQRLYPSDDITAEDVENDTEIEIGPLCRSSGFCNIP